MFSTCRFLMVFIIGLFLAAWLPGCDDDNGNASNQGPALTREPIPTKIPDTGQTASFTTTFGEDADYIIHPQSYTKLDNNGAALPDNAADWAMVQDNVTGLIWEVKTDDDSIHDKGNTYEWLYARNEYTKELNEQAFGGYTDWRLPYVRELSYLVHLGDPFDPQQGLMPSIQTAYFPNTLRNKTGFWTYDIVFNAFDSGWYVDFQHGSVHHANQEEKKYVRAVRGDAAWEHDDYTDNGDGTVTDRYTGLIWQLETAEEEMTWEGALDYCEHLSLAGYTDWRLPNRNELQSLVDKQPAEDHDPNIPAAFQESIPDSGAALLYWTSSSDVWPTDRAWSVSFLGGLHGCYNAKDDTLFVRAVRAGTSVVSTARPSGTPRLLWVSSRDAPGGASNAIYAADPDFSQGLLSNVSRQTSLSWLGLYTSPTLMAGENRIVCAMTQGSMLYTDIWSVDLATGIPTRLTRPEDRNNILPVVTPDQTIIYVTMTRADDSWALRRMKLDGSEKTLLTHIPNPVESLAISPDGRQLALIQVHSGGNDIYSLSADGQNLSRITDTPGISESSVNYTPAGKLIFAAPGVVEGQADIYQINPDGTGRTRMTNGEMPFTGPLWQYGPSIVFENDCDLWVYDIISGENTRLTQTASCEFQHSIHLVP